MTKYNALRIQAIATAKERGHRLAPFHFTLKPNRMIGYSSCYRCHCAVQINTNPLPNDIEISGEAMALNCTH